MTINKAETGAEVSELGPEAQEALDLASELKKEIDVLEKKNLKSGEKIDVINFEVPNPLAYSTGGKPETLAQPWNFEHRREDSASDNSNKIETIVLSETDGREICISFNQDNGDVHSATFRSEKVMGQPPCEVDKEKGNSYLPGSISNTLKGLIGKAGSLKISKDKELKR